jgi:hypothetical protein
VAGGVRDLTFARRLREEAKHPRRGSGKRRCQLGAEVEEGEPAPADQAVDSVDGGQAGRVEGAVSGAEARVLVACQGGSAVSHVELDGARVPVDRDRVGPDGLGQTRVREREDASGDGAALGLIGVEQGEVHAGWWRRMSVRPVLTALSNSLAGFFAIVAATSFSGLLAATGRSPAQIREQIMGDLLMDLKPLDAERIHSIVDELFLPLVRGPQHELRHRSGL